MGFIEVAKNLSENALHRLHGVHVDPCSAANLCARMYEIAMIDDQSAFLARQQGQERTRRPASSSVTMIVDALLISAFARGAIGANPYLNVCVPRLRFDLQHRAHTASRIEPARSTAHFTFATRIAPSSSPRSRATICASVASLMNGKRFSATTDPVSNGSAS